TSELRWARHDADRLPALAADLVKCRVALIVTLDTVSAARAAKAATTEIPIVFALGTDPVQAGLVASLNRPGGNITGISTMNLDLGSKWIELLHELRPAAKRFAVLVNIENADSARSIITRTQEAALALVNADREIVRKIMTEPGPRWEPQSPPRPKMRPTFFGGRPMHLSSKAR